MNVLFYFQSTRLSIRKFTRYGYYFFVDFFILFDSFSVLCFVFI